MRIYHNQLNQHLAGQLANVWLVFGDEQWQKQDALTRINQSAVQQGFVEKLTFSADDKFHWQQLMDEYQSMSLFASQRVIEVELLNKVSQSGVSILEKLAEQLHQDTILIFHGAKLDAATTNKKWFKHFSNSGVYLPVYELDNKGLKRWLDTTARQYQLNLPQDSTDLLISLFEGNLLALDQELQKLSILYANQQVSSENINELAIKQAKFNPFQLIDALLAGDLPRCFNILELLKQEGSAAGQIIWFVHKELNTLQKMHLAQENGDSFDVICKSFRIWRNKEMLYKNALSRFTAPAIALATARLADVDLITKTTSDFDPFLLLADVCTSLLHPEVTKNLSLSYEY